MKIYNILFALILFIYGCEKPDIEILNFNPFSNFNIKNDSLLLYMDYSGAIDSGFVVPSINQVKEGKFKVSFDIVNNTNEEKQYYYKIYYQNESYKFSEVIVTDTSKTENYLASENFYGSWENTSKTFVPTEVISPNKNYVIEDYIRIVGNPRNEQKYFGQPNAKHDESDIISTIKRIEGAPDWYKSIVEKAKNNNISVDVQLRLDAIFILNQEVSAEGENQRWKRNPRVGNYKFMLVVIDKEEYEKNVIPEFVQDISKTNGEHFINPFYYFLYGEGSKLKGVNVITNDDLKVIAKPNLSGGIFIDKHKLIGKEIDKSYYNNSCGESEDLYKKANFQQFFHDLRSDDKIKNIPIVKDIFNEKFTIEDFENNKLIYPEDKLLETNVSLTNCPCKTVQSDDKNNKLVMINPATKEGEWRKESVGIKSRHGFTYGKFRAKVKLTKLLNEDGVWNGITNAIWLIYQNGKWNNRRISTKEGYIPKDQYGPNSERYKEIDYSEIDIEIVKTSKDWPKTSYSEFSGIQPFKNDKKEDIIVACTNWDMANPEPKKFNIGVHELNKDGEIFQLHRWDHWYKAVTLKTPVNERELFDSDFYYYEIDWKPTEITWRIGTSPDKMREIGYMNEEYTSIPNNQMLMVFTQEFHLGDWWPMTQFHQNYIPFPKKDYVGEIYEIVIE